MQRPKAESMPQAWRDTEALRSSALWQALEGTGASVFETSAWFENLAATCSWREPVLWLGQQDEAGSSLLPLRQGRDGRLESLSNYYASLYGPVASDAAAPTRHAQAYAQWIAASGAPTLRLHPLAEQDPFWPALSAALRTQGYWVDRYFAFGNWLQPTTGQSGADYLAARPSRLRHTLQRVRKKLAARSDFRAEILDAGTPWPQVEQAVQHYCEVYAHSWKRPEPFPAFVPGLCKLAHRMGWLRLGLCFLEGRPVAAQIWLVRNGKAAIYKLAYDERYAAHGVGTWISAALSEHVLDVDQVSEIDFLAGDDPYKAEWMSERRERVGLIAFRQHSAAGLLAAARHYGVKLLRKAVAAPNHGAKQPSGRPARSER
jgi:hypothetical protein